MQYKPKLNDSSITGVPTTIITGFLGAGKTSAILQLLKNKPKLERWAILVNEFGEIGIDGALIKGKHSEQDGVFIREVPGGCMCCAAGLPMRVALAQLLRRAKPDRLLIEPTGLGHPKEVLQALTDADFQDVLSVQNIVTLVDARHLSDSQYVEHETFQQQIAIADIIVGNKQDLYSDTDKAALKTYLATVNQEAAPLVFTEHGVIEPSLLEGIAATVSETSNSASSGTASSTNHQVTSVNLEQPYDTSLPECGYLTARNKGQGHNSIGWRFSAEFEFEHTKLFTFLSGINAERLKATFITDNGFFGYNLAKNTLTETSFEHFDESRVEIIANHISDDWEQGLFDCLKDGQANILNSQAH